MANTGSPRRSDDIRQALRRTVLLVPVASLLIGYHPPASGHGRESLPATCFNWKGSPGPRGLLGSLVTDRPDFTESSTTVGMGVAQIETGYTLVQDDGTRTHSLGEPLLRMGLLADWLEFRTGLSPSSVSTKTDGDRTTDTGLEDLYLGVKLALTSQEGLLPEVGLIAQMTVPTGTSGFTADRVQPGVNLLYSWDVTDVFSMGGSTQYNRAVEDADQDYGEWAQSVTSGFSLTERLGTYVEGFAMFPHGAAEMGPQYYINSGLTLLFSSDIQFDVRVGLGLNDGADDLFAGTGLSFRLR